MNDALPLDFRLVREETLDDFRLARLELPERVQAEEREAGGDHPLPAHARAPRLEEGAGAIGVLDHLAPAPGEEVAEGAPGEDVGLQVGIAELPRERLLALARSLQPV